MKKVLEGRVTKTQVKRDDRHYYYATCVFSKQINQAITLGPIVAMAVEQAPLAFVFWTRGNSLTAETLETMARTQLDPLTQDSRSFGLSTMTVLEINRAQHAQISKQLETRAERIGDKIVLLKK